MFENFSPTTMLAIKKYAYWLWLLLAPVALSSVALNLPSQVFKPLVSLFSPIEPSVYEARGRLPREQLGETRLDYDRTFQLASVEAARLGIAEPDRKSVV